jgi:hypothetical protein
MPESTVIALLVLFAGLLGVFITAWATLNAAGRRTPLWLKAVGALSLVGTLVMSVQLARLFMGSSNTNSPISPIATRLRSTFVPTTAPTSVPNQISEAKMTPEQFIRYYYSLASTGQYDLSWPLLTEKRNQEGNDNKDLYIKWWKGLDHFNLEEVKVVKGSPINPAVFIVISYKLNEEEVFTRQELTFQLVLNKIRDNWQIDHIDRASTIKFNK